MYLGASIFPTGAAATVVDGITEAITDNIGVVLTILAFTVGLAFVFRLFNRSLKHKL